ncbi:MAG: lysophospholipid acyltransferase family protein [Pseudomonadota bacterium]
MPTKRALTASLPAEQRTSLRQLWRIAAAGVSYVLFALGGVLPAFYSLLLSVAPLDTAVKQQKLRRLIAGLCRFYIGLMKFLGLFQYSITDLPDQTTRGHVIIANHSMLIDALFVLGYLDNVCCVVKASLATNPFTRVPVALAGYVTNSDPKLLETATHKLAAGENILIFPEGTRNSFDLQLEFKRGAANLAVIAGAPLLPVLLLCRPRALGKGEKWYELPAENLQITMQCLPAVQVENCIDTTLPRPLQYRRLTSHLTNLYRDAISQAMSR